MADDKRYGGQKDEQDEQLNEEFEPIQEEEQPEETQLDEPETDSRTELDQLLDFMLDSLDAAPVVPLSNGKRMVNIKVFYDIVNDIRRCLPDEIRYSQEIMRKRDRIIHDAQTSAESKIQAADARADAAIDDANHRAQTIVHEAEDRAAGIIEQAQTRARAMIDQSEILRLAHEEANQVCEEARADASDQRREANNYIEALLKGLEADVQATLEAVQNSLKNFSGSANK